MDLQKTPDSAQANPAPQTEAQSDNSANDAVSEVNTNSDDVTSNSTESSDSAEANNDSVMTVDEHIPDISDEESLNFQVPTI